MEGCTTPAAKFQDVEDDVYVGVHVCMCACVHVCMCACACVYIILTCGSIYVNS